MAHHLGDREGSQRNAGDDLGRRLRGGDRQATLQDRQTDAAGFRSFLFESGPRCGEFRLLPFVHLGKLEIERAESGDDRRRDDKARKPLEAFA